MGDKFNENLRKARERADLTQKEMAERLGVAKSTYSLYEAGTRQPDVAKIKKIAAILGVSADTLLGLPGAPTTLAAHFEGEYFSEEEIQKIEEFVNFVKSQRKG